VSHPLVNIPQARSWREIPQPVKPRTMSREGRWRLASSLARVLAGVVVTFAVAWGAWQVAAALQENPQLMPAAAVQRAAEAAFAGCGCRDYARVDFILPAQGGAFLLEINTLPGMKETSLLPMSARCAGLDFAGLVRELVTPALQRFRAAAVRP
jgi:hypothetical protein